ncbi:MAG: BamA/TamA family outer membrane protein [Vicinamibacterales bacterium]
MTRRLAALLVALVSVTATASAQSPGIVREVRVHGNHTTPDSDVLAIAAVPVGEPATDTLLAAARARLEDSGRFDGVEVLRRFRSIDDPTDLVVILMVDERLGVSEDDLTPGPLRRLSAAGMWMPLLSYEDGYGVSYGARFSLVGPLGEGSRLSVPLTWGGDRRVAIEADRTFTRGAVTRLAATAGVSRRENPFDDIADTRRGVSLRIERAFGPWLRVAGLGGASRVDFEQAHENGTTAGAELVLDTRLDPSFPRNAVHAALRVERARYGGRDALRRTSADVRGYVGLIRSTVLAVRAQASLAAAPLPRYERALLGGQASLRGLRAGTAAGDNLAAFSVELRAPLTSPISVGRFGVKVFADAGTVWDAGDTLSGRQFTRGAGAGVFMGVSLFSINVDIAHTHSATRVSISAGLGF